GATTYSSGQASRACTSSRSATPATPPTGGSRTAPAPRPCCAAAASTSSSTRKVKSSSAAAASSKTGREPSTPPCGETTMIESVMFWNEPNNQSHWDFEIDPDWAAYGAMTKLAADPVGP